VRLPSSSEVASPRSSDAPGRARGASMRRLCVGAARRIGLLALTGALLTAGCGHLGVKAHQRELLADRIMRLDGNPQERAADEHVLANREGAIGGSGTSGGGCGCN
jgi:hypothetical protein